MKNTLKLFAIGLLIFILLSIVIASWYTLSLNYLTQYNFKDIIKIFVQIGLVGAIIPSLTTLLIYYFILKIKNKNTAVNFNNWFNIPSVLDITKFIFLRYK